MKWMLLILLLWPAFSFASSSPATAGAGVLVKVMPVQRKALSQTITAYGTVSADPTAQTALNARHEAVVVNVMTTVGDPVRAGASLLVLETAPASREAYRQALAGVRFAKQELQRQRRLKSRQLATHSDVAAARKALDDARATLSARRHEGSNQAKTVVKAPFDGVITAMPAQAGQHLQIGSAMLTLARANHVLVHLGVPPIAAGTLSDGADVTVTPVFGDGGGIKAVVDRVQRIADPRTGLIGVLVRLDGKANSTLIPGTPVSGKITLAKANTLAVQRSALLKDKQGSYVYVVSKGTAHRVNVGVGLRNGNWVGVSGGGLTTGNSVVVQGNYELSDGARVRGATQ